MPHYATPDRVAEAIAEFADGIATVGAPAR